MRATTVRFTEDQWELLEREARRQHVSTAQLVRDAAVLRVAFLMGRRGDPEAEATLASLAAAAATAGRREHGVAVPAAVRDPARLRSLRAGGLLEAAAGHPALDRLARLAARLLDAPVALVTLVDAEREVIGACPGLSGPWAERGELPLDRSVCMHVVDRGAPLAIRDAREDPLVRDNLAVPDLGVVAYLGAPLTLADGHVAGALCVIDHRPRHWTADQVAVIADLAASVVTELELERRP